MNKYCYLYILIGIISVLSLSTCEKDEMQKRDYPRVRTLAVTDINEEGATFHGEIISLGQGGVNDYGFIWSTSYSPALDFSERVSLGPFAKTGHYSAQISTTLRKNYTYRVRSYLKNEDYIVYGTIVEFISLGSGAPQIDKIEPGNGTWNDTIDIIGKNFSYQNTRNSVEFNTVTGTVISSSDTVISVKVPLNLFDINTYISVTIVGNKSVSGTQFTLNPPFIENISPTSGFDGDTITVFGENFYPAKGKNSFSLGEQPGTECSLISATGDIAKIVVPADLNYGFLDLSVSVLGQVDHKDDYFFSTSPNIVSVDPDQGTFNDTIQVHGSCFHPEIPGNSVLFDDIESQIISYSDSLIEVIVPSALDKTESTITIVIKSIPYETSISFILLPPFIENVSPGTITFGDTAFILGNNFNPDIDKNSVKIGNASAFILTSSKDELVIRIPNDVYIENSQANVEVSIGEPTAIWENKLVFPPPEIFGFSPNPGIVGESLTILGKYFNPSKSHNIFCLGNLIPEIIASTNSSLQIKIPFETDPTGSETTVIVNGQTGQPGPVFELAPLIVNSIEPNQGYRGTIIVIEGENFSYNPLQEYNPFNQVQFSNHYEKTTPKAISNSELRFSVPGSGYPEGLNPIEIFVGLQSLSFPDSFIFIEPWKRVADYPTHRTENCAHFVIENKAYVGMGNYDWKSFWEYDPIEDRWTRLADYPGSSTWTINGFAIQDTGYIFSGSEFYAYHPETNSWERKTNNPSFSGWAISFVCYGKAYVGLGNHNKILWEYDPTLNQWTRMADFPYDGTFQGVGLSILNKGYVHDGFQGFFEFDPLTNEWKVKASVPKAGLTAVGFSIGNKGYIGTGYNSFGGGSLSDFFEYNPIADSWTRKVGQLSVAFAFGFSIGEKGYIGGGGSSYINKKVYEYDPSK